MAIEVHTISQVSGSTFARLDRILLANLVNVANAKGDGGIATVPVASAGAGYTTIPTVAIAGTGALGAGSGAAATAVMKVVSATIAAGGSGYTNGAQVLTGTTGTGTKVQVNVTVAGGIVTAITGIAVAGAYTVLPTLAGEATTGPAGTGATLNLVMGVASITVGTAGSGYPDLTSTATLSGGTPTTAAVLGIPTITSANGAPSKTHIAFKDMPPLYGVNITPSQQCQTAVLNKLSTGFDIVLYPPSGSALAAGTFDALVVA
ncbi:hypothetical protein [Rhizobium lusitanum]|uniref:hypothetical protein n=1 Tax=Rhizobium lusitanum TaxID=293958 RepID=UPI001959F70F|nr:hypothetical protein [Rhizobium lusitanum]MBM7045431.1 hypothetical protein [Rhizobium lusitanum]